MPNTSLPHFPKNLQEQIIENSPSGMMLVDAQQPDMPIVYVNKAFERMTGYTADEALGKNARFLQGDDRQQPAIEQMRHALAAHENVVTTLRNYRKDGSLFWNEVRISYLRDPQGTVTHAVGVLNDITAHTEDAERYRQSFESNSAVHLLVDADDGHIVDANSAAARFYGYTVAQLTSMHIYEINMLGKEKFLRLSNLVVSERESNFVTQHRLASGAVRDVQVYASSIRTPQGWLNHEIIVDVTDRLTVEQRYQSLFKQSNDAVFILDLDGHHLQVNQRACDLLGYSVEELLQLSNRDIVVPQELHESMGVLERLKSGEQVPPYSRVFRRRDGTLIDTELNVELVRDSRGNPLHVLSIVRDISERKQIEDALRESEESYRQTIATMHEGLVLQKADGRIQLCNPAAERILGLTADQMMGRISTDPRWRAIHEDYSPFPGETHPAMFTLRTGEPQFNVVMGVYKPDDTLTWILINAQPLFNEVQEKPYAVVATFADITERKQMEDALRESEEKYRLIAENTLAQKYDELDQFFNVSAGMLTITNTDGILLKVNKAWEKLLGLPVAQIEGQRFLDFVHPDDVPATLGAMEQLSHQKPVIEFVNRYRTADGSYRYIEWRTNPHGSLIYASSRDITERKRLENTLAQKYDELDQFFNVSTNMLCIATMDGIFLKVNKAWEKLLGLPVAQIEGQRFLDFVHPDDVPATLGAMEQLSQEKPVIEFVNRYRAADGSYRYIEWRTNPHGNLIYASARDITEHKRTEEILARLAAIVTFSSDAIISETLDGIITSWNSGAEQMFGYSASEVLQKPVTMLTPPEKAGEETMLLQKIAAGETVLNYETLRLKKKGNAIFVSVSVSPVVDAHGTIIGAAKIIHDITKRHQMENALRESEEKYRLIAENTSDGIMIIEGDTRITSYASPTYDRQHGREIGESLGMGAETRWSHIHPDDREAVIQQIKDTIVHRQTHLALVYRALHRDGHYFWREDYARYFYAPDGTYQRTYIISRDITGRKRMEEALKESEEKYRLIAENTSDGILVLDSLLGAITYASPSYDLQHGRAMGETQSIEPPALLETIHPEDRERVLQQIFAAVDRKEPNLVYSYRSQHKDGHYLWCEDHSHFNYAPDGRYVSSIIISRNVTERKEAEQRRMELQLEQERTELLTRFISDAAHEFRTPLSIIGSATYLLLRSDKPEVRQHKSDSIEAQIKRITRLLDSLLLMAQVDSPDTLEKSPVGIGLILLSECQYAQDAYGNHPAMRQMPFPHLLDVMGDADLLMDAFRQIIDNARRFTPKDGSVTVAAGMEGDQLWVEITDTGIGIAPENLPKVFNTFWRQDDAHFTAGFGLGLPIAKRIIERHGGTIAVKSQLGQGTQVRVTLPAAP